VEALTSPEGSLALAIAALLLVLGFRFARPTRAHEWIAFAAYAAALALSLLAARGLVPGAAIAAGAAVRLAGGAALVAGLLLAAAAAKTRRLTPAGELAVGGPYRRARRPLEVGLALVLVGHLLRAPSSLGSLAVGAAVAFLVWSAWREDRIAQRTFGAEWRRWAAATPFLLPSLRRRG
jgi:protein-S-isoprenylcysteine O-methyltransferase Ste14